MPEPKWPEQVCCYAPAVLPGFLQTRPYTNAVYRRDAAARDLAERHAAIWKQIVLAGTPGRALPLLRVVIEESALMFEWGTAAERRRQALTLAAISRRPNVEMRIHRFRDGPPPVLEQGIALVRPDQKVLVIPESGTMYGSGFTAGAFLKSFGAACDAAPGPGDTTVLLEKLAQETELPP